MPTLRLTLFDKSFEVLDRIDVAVAGPDKQGAGEASKAAKHHFWENHFKADLDPLMASRENLLQRLDHLTAEVEALQKWESQSDLHLQVKRVNLTEAKAAVIEAKMMNDLSLPAKYKKELEEKFGKKER